MATVNPKTLFGRQVRLIRAARDLSQEDLADKAKIHRTFVGQVERGETNISIVNIVRLAHALGVRPSKLLDNIK